MFHGDFTIFHLRYGKNTEIAIRRPMWSPNHSRVAFYMLLCLGIPSQSQHNSSFIAAVYLRYTNVADVLGRHAFQTMGKFNTNANIDAW